MQVNDNYRYDQMLRPVFPHQPRYILLLAIKWGNAKGQTGCGIGALELAGRCEDYSKQKEILRMRKRMGVAFTCIMALLLTFGSSGCATMIRGTSETLEVTSEPSQANVELSDGRSGQTPAQFKTKRDKTVLVKIAKEGYYTESVTVSPTVAGAGILLGGIIDYGTGAVYNLTPNPVHVILKEKPVEK